MSLIKDIDCALQCSGDGEIKEIRSSLARPAVDCLKIDEDNE